MRLPSEQCSGCSYSLTCRFGHDGWPGEGNIVYCHMHSRAFIFLSKPATKEELQFYVEHARYKVCGDENRPKEVVMRTRGNTTLPVCDCICDMCERCPHWYGTGVHREGESSVEIYVNATFKLPDGMLRQEVDKIDVSVGVTEEE